MDGAGAAKAQPSGDFARKAEETMFPRRPSHKVQLLERVPILSGLRRKHLDLIARHADQVTLDTGAVWAGHGRIPREVLFVVEGASRVERDGEAIGRLGAGDFFGDLELVDGERRTERVIAETPVALMVVEARSLSYLQQAIPELRTRLLGALSGRLQKAEEAQPTSIGRPGYEPAVEWREPIPVSESTSS
jgi:CRP-like cAMP-binding protein